MHVRSIMVTGSTTASRQPFVDACAVYYGDGFNDCIKQVGSVYANLDLSRVTLDDPMPTTAAASDTIDNETDESTHVEQGVQDDVVALAQPAQERSVTPVIPSTEDLPHQVTENPDAQNSPPKGDETTLSVQNPQSSFLPVCLFYVSTPFFRQR